MISSGDRLRGLQRFILILSVVSLIVACRHETKVDVAAKIHPETMPTMMTRNISTLISDSGVTQYKIVSPLWYVYDEVDTPYWSFPEGLYLQKFDRHFKVIASVAADSAVYFKKEKIWRLDGNVEMRKAPADLFLTQQLFWDQRRRIIYSDSFIHIQTPTQVLEGYGFESAENLLSYRVKKPIGLFPVNKDKLKGSE